SEIGVLNTADWLAVKSPLSAIAWPLNVCTGAVALMVIELTVTPVATLIAAGNAALEKVAWSGRVLSHVADAAPSSQLLFDSQSPLLPFHTSDRGELFVPVPVQARWKLLTAKVSRLPAPVDASSATTRSQTFCDWLSIPVIDALALSEVEPKLP